MFFTMLIKSFLFQISILFKTIIIFFPFFINELILETSFLFKSPAIVNKISSELLICENIFSGSLISQRSKPGESINSIVLRL